jgi:RecA/RadA recombinase
MYFNIDDAFEKGEPFIYIGDSMDSLTPRADNKSFKEMKKAIRAGREEKGSFGMAKAKRTAEMLRKVMTPLGDTGSMLLLISQSKENVNSMFGGKSASGGTSLKFYAAFQLWLSKRKSLTKTVRGKDREVGIISKISIKKNRLTGKGRTVEVPIYNSFKGGGGGFDDMGSCIDYLIEEKHWKKTGQKIYAPEFDFVGSKEDAIKHLKYRKLQRIVGKVWNEIEEECTVERKNRYEISAS